MPGGVTLCLTASMVVVEHDAVNDCGAKLKSTCGCTSITFVTHGSLRGAVYASSHA